MADGKNERAQRELTDEDLVVNDESVEDLEVEEKDSDGVRGGGCGHTSAGLQASGTGCDRA